MTNSNSIKIVAPKGYTGNFVSSFAHTGKSKGGMPYLFLKGVFSVDAESTEKIDLVLGDLALGAKSPDGGYYGVMYINPDGDLFDALVDVHQGIVLKGVRALMGTSMEVSIEVNSLGEKIGEPKPHLEFRLLSVEGIELASAGENAPLRIRENLWNRKEKGAEASVPKGTVEMVALKAAID